MPYIICIAIYVISGGTVYIMLYIAVYYMKRKVRAYIYISHGLGLLCTQPFNNQDLVLIDKNFFH